MLPPFSDHGYWFKPEEVGVRFQPGAYAPDSAATAVQLLMWSSGAGAPRPVMLRKNKKGEQGVGLGAVGPFDVSLGRERCSL
jgi:hypothetical protein